MTQIHKRSAVKCRRRVVQELRGKHNARVAGGILINGGCGGGAFDWDKGGRIAWLKNKWIWGPIKGPPKSHVDDYDGQ